MDAPTCKQLYDPDTDAPEHGYSLVSQDHDPSWRHGTRETDVFHRSADDTYWSAHYLLSTDGETHELKEGLATIKKVYPHQVTVTRYSESQT